MTYPQTTQGDSPPLQQLEFKSRKWYRLPKVLSPSPKLKDGPTFRLGSLKFDSKSVSDESSSSGHEEDIDTSSGGEIFDEMTDKDAPLIEVEDPTGKEKFASLMSQDSLREALNDPIGLAKFGAFLASELGAEQLCFWLNAQQLSSDLQALQSLCQRVQDLHIPTAAPLALNLSSAERKQLLSSSSTFQNVEDPFAKSAEAAFHSMHQDPWTRFVKLRLTLAQKAFIKRSQRSRDSFCLVDLREGPEQIIGMASKGFQTLTGYSMDEILSMNCRVLQGPESSPDAIARIRKAIKLGADIQELMINYTKSGTPFWVLLQMASLRDETGAVRYVLGHQLNLTAQTSDLSWLLGDNLDVTRGHESEMSEMQKEAVSSSRSIACDRLENQARDRNKRLQEAAALAFDATSVKHSGPGHARERHSSFEVVRKPTSACAPLGILGATSSKIDRGIITDVEQIQDPSEIMQWRNKSPAKLVFLDPETLTIRFSSPSLPLDWAQGQSFAQLVQELNPSGTVASIRKLIAKQDFFTISPKLRVFPPGEAYVNEGRVCPLAVTPLIDRTRKVSAVVIMFGW